MQSNHIRGNQNLVDDKECLISRGLDDKEGSWIVNKPVGKLAILMIHHQHPGMQLNHSQETFKTLLMIRIT